MSSEEVLGWRTPVAIAFVVLCVLGSLGLDVTGLVVGNVREDDLGGQLGILAAAAGTLISLFVSAVFFCIWIHRAAVNVRRVGQRELQFTPGWAVGWWFVPIASLFKPLQVVKEIWRASDPATVGGDGLAWQGSSPAPPSFGVWWGLWIASEIIGQVSGKIEDVPTSSMVGLMGTLLMALSAGMLVSIMRQLEGRQRACFARLRELQEQQPQYNSFLGAGAPPPAGGYGAPY